MNKKIINFYFPVDVPADFLKKTNNFYKNNEINLKAVQVENPVNNCFIVFYNKTPFFKLENKDNGSKYLKITDFEVYHKYSEFYTSTVCNYIYLKGFLTWREFSYNNNVIICKGIKNKIIKTEQKGSFLDMGCLNIYPETNLILYNTEEDLKDKNIKLIYSEKYLGKYESIINNENINSFKYNLDVLGKKIRNYNGNYIYELNSKIDNNFFNIITNL